MFPQPPPGQPPIDPRGAFGAAPSGPAPQYPAPMMMMPPMPYPPYPTPPRGGGWVRGIFLTLATTIFGLSLTLNLYLLIYTGLFSGGGGTTHTSVLEDGAEDQQIAVIPIREAITDATFQQFDRWIKVIEDDGNVKAIVIEVDTPGGEVAPSDQIHRRIEQIKADRKLPVVVAMGGLATSGGYYVSANADHILAQPTTWTGNIGVRFDRLNLAKMADKVGIEDNSLQATGADFKTAGSPWRAERPEERAYWVGLLDDAFATFKQVVVDGRQKKLNGTIESIANGKVYSAKEALALGLVDQIGYFDDACAVAAKLAGLQNPKVVRYSRPPSFFESLGAEGALKLKGDGTVHVDRSTIDKLLQPRVLYQWNGH